MIIISICSEFSNTPGGRYTKDGKFSGQEFRDTLLIPNFKKAQENNEKLTVNLDGSYGYPTSFLEESFGGLARVFGSRKVLNVIEIISNDQPGLIEDIENYIINCCSKRRQNL